MRLPSLRAQIDSRRVRGGKAVLQKRRKRNDAVGSVAKLLFHVEPGWGIRSLCRCIEHDIQWQKDSNPGESDPREQLFGCFANPQFFGAR